MKTPSIVHYFDMTSELDVLRGRVKHERRRLCIDVKVKRTNARLSVIHTSWFLYFIINFDSCFHFHVNIFELFALTLPFSTVEKEQK